MRLLWLGLGLGIGWVASDYLRRRQEALDNIPPFRRPGGGAIYGGVINAGGVLTRCLAGCNYLSETGTRTNPNPRLACRMACEDKVYAGGTPGFYEGR